MKVSDSTIAAIEDLVAQGLAEWHPDDLELPVAERRLRVTQAGLELAGETITRIHEAKE